ncbi:hypothetical protein CU103_07890 [Phyllobacterium sophorae]|uniref:Uncharacterized protein n=1 Tax=Phyllobacterium sophorae TaxID=1520277 RepID=A0A2P7BGE6_9HYPH|nr:hypothetical protein CU103_07890 [Phyllobacterium sophorae]
MGLKMDQKLDHGLGCPDCGTIYLNIPKHVTGDTPITCTTCGRFLGSWGDLEQCFNRQGGQYGVFEMHDGLIIRKG